MAKIENTTVYPTVVPSMEDLLIATDVSDNNETVTFLVSDLIGGAGILQGLQSVLDTGNTATQTMQLTGSITLLGGPNVGFLDVCQIRLGGGPGAAGEVITSQGAGSCAIWAPAAATSCCSWNDSLLIGNIATTKSIIDGVKMEVINVGGGIDILSPATLTNSGISTFTGQVNINSTDINFNATGQINDGAGSVGAVGEWLTATATGVAWSSAIPPAACCNIQDVLGIGSTSLNQGVSFTGTSSVTFAAGVSIGSSGDNVWSGTNTFSGPLVVSDCLVDSAFVCGTVGQVLTSTGTGVIWQPAGAGGQDLQAVLDLGNSATGVNADISITGTIAPGTVTDTSLSVGAAGQLLSSTGTGLAWITAGASAPVTDVNAAGATTSVGSALTITPTTGNVVVTPHIYDGTTNIGVVPTGGSASTFLRGDGTWVTPSGSAVIDVDETTPGTSTGTPIVVNPTTGNVLVQSMVFDGSSNVGHVPDSSAADQTKTFLRADGTWVTPTAAAATFEQVIRIDFGAENINFIGNELMIYKPFTGIAGSADPKQSHQTAEYSIGTAGPAVGITTNGEHMNATVLANPGVGSCVGPAKMTICDATITLVSSRSSGTIRVNLWKTDACTLGTYNAALECDLTLADSAMSCCTTPSIVTSGYETLETDKAYILTWTLIDTSDAALYVQGTMWLRIQYHS